VPLSCEGLDPCRAGVAERVPDELPLDGCDALLPPELPRGTACPVLVPPAWVRCCGASSRYAARDPPNPIVGTEADDEPDALALEMLPKDAADPAGAAGALRAPLSATVGRSMAVRSAAGVPPDSPGFCAIAGAAAMARAAATMLRRNVRNLMCAPPRLKLDVQQGNSATHLPPMIVGFFR
jgi:hypothetical protein